MTISSIAQASTGSQAAAPQPRLLAAAHDFEAMMMKELLKPMTASAQDDSGSGDDTAGSGSALGEFASEALGRALSSAGGFGFANRIVGELSHSGSASRNETVTTKLHADTVLRTLK